MLGRNKILSSSLCSCKSPRKKKRRAFFRKGHQFSIEYFKTPFMRMLNNLNQGGIDDDLKTSLLRNIDISEYFYEH